MFKQYLFQIKQNFVVKSTTKLTLIKAVSTKIQILVRYIIRKYIIDFDEIVRE